MARLPLKPTLLAAAAALALSGPALAQDRPGAAGADMTTAGERASAVEASRRAGEVAPGTLDETRAAGQRVDSTGAADSDMAGRERIDTTGAVGATGTAGATGTTGATGAAGTTGATAGTGATTGAGADRRGTPGLDAASRSAAPTAGTTTGAGAGTTPGTTAATGATAGAAATTGTTGATVTDADRSPAGADAVGQEEELREEHGVRRPAEPGTRPEDDRAGYGPAGTAGQGGAAGAGPTGPGGVTGGTTGAGQLGTGGGG